MSQKLQIKVMCTHKDGNVECDLIEKGDLSDYWYKCPKCGREVGLIIKVEEVKT